MQPLCFASGNLYQLNGKKDVWGMIANLNVDGVEVSYGKTLEERALYEKDFEILNNYDFVSMHSPFKLIFGAKSESEIEKNITKMYVDYKKANAKEIVIHPTENLSKRLIDKFDINWVTENLNPKKYQDRPRDGFEIVLNENPSFNMCLDVSHAYDWGASETQRVVSKWKHRIKQIHFSNNRYHKDHLMFKKVSKDFLKSIDPIRELNVPIIIEEDMGTPNLQEIKEEIKRIRKILF
ncbi:MAG: hypothetical protein WC821_05215 [archaeon]|jgi:hypothetical protein